MHTRRPASVLMILALALLPIVAATPAVGTPVTAERPYGFVREFPAPTRHFVEPTDVSVAANGDVLVAEPYYKKVLRYSSAGSLVASYSVAATDVGGVNIPRRVAAAADGGFYVTLEDSNWPPQFRVVRCDASGIPLLSFSGRGTGTGQLDGWVDLDLAVESDGDVLVLDRGGSTVKRFSANGVYLGTIGSPGSGAGQVSSPQAIALDEHDTLYVADYDNARIAWYASNGASGSVDTTYGAQGVAARDGAVYYDDPFGTVSCIATDGSAISARSSADGWPIPVSALALSPDGSTLYACGGQGYNDGLPLAQVAVLAAPGLSVVGTWRSWGTAASSLSAPGDVAVGPDGTVYVTNLADGTVKRFTSSGTPIGTTTAATSLGPISTDATGYVYAGGPYHVLKFDSAMSPAGGFELPPGTSVNDIEVDSAGRLYIADADADLIRVYVGGSEIASWGVGGNGLGQLNGPASVALTPDGRYIWVSDVYKVAKYSVEGTYTGTSVCEHLNSSVWPIAVDPSGRLVVRDEDNVLRRYRADGTGVVETGGLGFGPLQFAHPAGMDFGPTGDLFVADTYNDRVQQLTPLSDSAPPVTEAEGNGTGWYPWEIGVRLTAVDGCSGVVGTRYRLSGATTSAESSYTGEFTITAEGTTTITFYSVDASGHVEPEKTAYARRDTSWPLITPSVSEGQRVSGDTTVTLTADDTMSGVDWIDWKLDGGAVTRVYGSSVRIPVTGAGYHTIQYKTSDKAGNAWPAFDDVMFRIDATSSELAGGNRFATGVQISRDAYPAGAQTVVLASGRKFPDALGAAALAAAYDAPLLLTEPTYLPDTVANEITRLGASRVIVIGGPTTVYEGVKDQAQIRLTGSAEATRVWGSDRYGTSKAVYDAFRARLADTGQDWAGKVIVANGENYPDALAASPLAAFKKWPIVLTKPAYLPSPTLAVIRGDVSSAIVVGGVSAVSDDVERDLEDELGIPNVGRLWGDNRYKTALAIIGRAETEGMHWDGVCIATGTNYADALAGGPYAAKKGTFVALTHPASLNPDLRAALTAKKALIGSVRFLGSTGAVTQPVRDDVMSALND